MARVRLNPALASFLGEVGDLVFKMRYGKVYAAQKPDSKPHSSTDAQKSARMRFRQATVYAKQVMADPEEREPYELAAKKKQTLIQNVIIADFLTAPSVDQIDLRCYDGRAGGTIRIRASDDFDVTGVTVSISGSEGEPIEHGAAVLSSMAWGRWVYTTTASIPAGTNVCVEATATDGPGNKATKSEDTVVAGNGQG